MKTVSYTTLIVFAISAGLIISISNTPQIATTAYAQPQQQPQPDPQPQPQTQPQPQQQPSQPPPQQPPQNATIYTFNQKSLPPNAPQNCAALASVVSGKAIPDYNLCDVVVYRQAPAIVRNDGFVLNNFSGLGHYIELMPAVLNNTGTFKGNDTSGATGQSSAQNANNMSVAFGEFALLDSEVVPVQNVMQKYNWTQTSLHHHMLNELPKVLFLHWSVTAGANDVINQAKEIIMQTSTYQSQQPRTPTSAGP